MKRRTVSCLLSVAAVLVCVSMAAASPIPLPRDIGDPTGTYGAPCPPGTTGVTPPGPAIGCGRGESDLSSAFKDGNTTQLNIDWLVLAPGDYSQAAWATINGVDDANAPTTFGAECGAGACYLYLYQEENTNPPGPIVGGVPSGIRMKALTITTLDGTVLIAGVLGPSAGGVQLPNPIDDLDLLTALHPAHSFPNLPGTTTADTPFESVSSTTNPEEEGICPIDDDFGDNASTPGALPGETGPGSGFCINPLDPIIPTIEPGGGVGFAFTPSKPPHHETVTLFYASLLPPVYGFANTQDTAPPAPWSTGFLDEDTGLLGEPVPVPSQVIPEPATLVLFGGGLVALGLLRRRMKR